MSRRFGIRDDALPLSRESGSKGLSPSHQLKSAALDEKWRRATLDACSTSSTPQSVSSSLNTESDNEPEDAASAAAIEFIEMLNDLAGNHAMALSGIAITQQSLSAVN